MKLKVKRLINTAVLPSKAYIGDLGWDLFSVEEVVIPPRQFKKIRTGIAIEFPDSIGALIKDRSSLASKGIFTTGGVIDSGYRGEIIIILNNFTDEEFIVKKGEKIAQLLLFKNIEVELVEVDKIGKTARNNKGFGSSGR